MSRSQPEKVTWAERACRSLIGLASGLVPTARRSAWREEWEAEVWYHLRKRGGPAAVWGVGSVIRCLGAFPHALWIRGEGWSMAILWQSARLAARRLWRDPAFSVPVVAVIGLAVAATATIFSSYEAVVLRALPYDEPSELLSVWAEHEERGWYQEYVAPANLFDWRESVDAFEDVAAYGDFSWEQIVTEGGEVEVVEAGPVSGNLFEVLGVPALLGRVFRPEETWSDAEPVVMLSHGFWLRRYGADPGVIGSRIDLSGLSYEIVGVMPRDFRYLAPDKELWIPFRWDPASRGDAFFRRAHQVRAVARLSPDASVEDAAVQLRSVAERLASEYPATNDGLSAGITPLREYLVGGRDMTLRALLGAVVILLLAACVNVGHLVLMRWTRRRREVGIRKALGAGPGALVRDAALENVLLSVLGAGVGVAGSLFGMKVLARLAPPELLASAELRVSGPLLAMSAAIMGLAALGFTFLPARATAGVSAAGFADQKVRSEVGVRRSAAIQSFVVLQIALSSVLIFSAVLLARSFVVLRSVDTGFTSAGVLTFAVPFPDASDETSEQRARTARQITRDVGDLPGVTATGAVRRLPVIGNGWTSFFTVEGASPDAQSFEIVHRGADSGYFETMRVPIHRGRLLRTDEGDALLVNETFARRAFGDEDPIGRRIAFTEEPSQTTLWWRIVGVVGDERQNGLRSAARPEVFTGYSFDTPSTLRFVVRTSGDPINLVPQVRSVLRAVDASLPMDEIATLEDIVSRSLAEERFLAILAGAFAFLAALLAVVGVYGVTAQLAHGWRREFAVRIAVGAAPSSLFAIVVSRAAALVVGGLLLGGFGALAMARVVEALLFETSASDPKLVLAAAALVAVTGIAAAVPSAVRAMRTDPARSLAG